MLTFLEILLYMLFAVLGGMGLAALQMAVSLNRQVKSPGDQLRKSVEADIAYIKDLQRHGHKKDWADSALEAFAKMDYQDNEKFIERMEAELNPEPENDQEEPEEPIDPYQQSAYDFAMQLMHYEKRLRAYDTKRHYNHYLKRY